MAASEPSPFRRLIARLVGRPWRPLPAAEERRPEPEQVARERFRVQQDVIRRAYEDDVAVGTNSRDQTEGIPTTYLYRPGHLLVRSSHVEQVAELVARRIGADTIERVATPTTGLDLLRFPTDRDDDVDVPTLLDEIDERFPTDDPAGSVAAPDHILYVTNWPRMCPATEPEVPGSRGPWPAPARDRKLGHGVRVSVVDTGLWQPATTNPKLPWLTGVTADSEDLEALDATHLHPYAGHGTFVAGVVRCVAPATEIEVEGVLTHGGAVYESEIITQLQQALEEDSHPQLISISAGTHTRNNLALLSFEMLAAAHGLDDGEKTLIVAAAGNDGDDAPFWPAAFPWVASVGAVDADGSVADYSNVGRWVDVYARGTDLVNAFPTGTYVCYEPPHVGEVRKFDSLARWSGTSFSTPIVTGLIAARMSSTGESATQAWAAVRAAGQPGSDPRAGRFVRVGPLV